jgi:hypothetical protein
LLPRANKYNFIYSLDWKNQVFFPKYNQHFSLKKNINPATPKIKWSLYKVIYGLLNGFRCISYSTRDEVCINVKKLAADIVQQSVINLGLILLITG